MSAPASPDTDPVALGRALARALRDETGRRRTRRLGPTLKVVLTREAGRNDALEDWLPEGATCTHVPLTTNVRTSNLNGCSTALEVERPLRVVPVAGRDERTQPCLRRVGSGRIDARRRGLQCRSRDECRVGGRGRRRAPSQGEGGAVDLAPHIEHGPVLVLGAKRDASRPRRRRWTNADSTCGSSPVTRRCALAPSLSEADPPAIGGRRLHRCAVGVGRRARLRGCARLDRGARCDDRCGRRRGARTRARRLGSEPSSTTRDHRVTPAKGEIARRNRLETCFPPNGPDDCVVRRPCDGSSRRPPSHPTISSRRSSSPRAYSSRAPIASLPGHFQHTVASLREEVRTLVRVGVRGVLLFGVPMTKDEVGSGAWDPDGIAQVALRELRDEFGDDIVLMADLCLDEYTSHGHCGVAAAPTARSTTTRPSISTPASRSPRPRPVRRSSRRAA